MQIREHEGVKGKRDFYPFDPRLLKIDEQYNIRNLDAPDERESLDELKEQVRESGVRVPLEVRLAGEDVLIVAGHRRHKVVMELIGEGVEIETVPIIHEPKWASDAERDLSLITSNSGKPLSPMQKAEVVRRLLVHGWDEKKIATKIGVTDNTVKRFIEMLALPEAVKEQVKQGDVSATLAVQTVKNLPAGTDPDFAAKLFADNKAENKKFGVGAKKNHKVTAKTLNRGKRNAEPTRAVKDTKADPVDTPAPPLSGVSESRVEHVGGNEAGLVEHNDVTTLEGALRKFDDGNFEALTGGSALATLKQQQEKEVEKIKQDVDDRFATRNSMKNLIEALEPFASLAHEQDFNERGDDEVIEVPFKHLKRAWVVFAKVTGGGENV